MKSASMICDEDQCVEAGLTNEELSAMREYLPRR
jgi:hypothetical protein